MAVTLRSAEGQVEVAVTDSGPGLGSDQLERVSGRFYSEPGSATGIGLGLPIVRAIARAHDGEIVASSPVKLRDIALRIPPMLGYDHLHFGYWEGLEINADNLAAAQSQYERKLAAYIPDGVRTILDVGCGTGALATHLLNSGYKVDCLAPDPELVKRTRERLGDGAEVHVSTFEEFESERCYDLVLMSESCHCINSRECSRKAAELLAPGGYLLACDFFRHRASPRNKTYISRTGHNIDRFLGHAEENGFVLEERVDITDHVGPTLDLYQEFLTERVLPLIDSCLEVFQLSHPWLYRIARLLFARRALHLRKKYAHQGLDDFRQSRAYLTLRLRKERPRAPRSV